MEGVIVEQNWVVKIEIKSEIIMNVQINHDIKSTESRREGARNRILADVSIVGRSKQEIDKLKGVRTMSSSAHNSLSSEEWFLTIDCHSIHYMHQY